METDHPNPAQDSLAPSEPSAPVQQMSAPLSSPPPREPLETRAVLWMFWGPNGMRAGWSILCFLLVLALIATPMSEVFIKFHLIGHKGPVTAWGTFLQELLLFVPAAGAAAVMALIERRRGNLLAYNLLGPNRATHFFAGTIAGFAALSALVGGLHAGHWLEFGPVALSGAAVLKFAAVWGLAFLLVAGFEEGVFRCYLQATLTRGLNFWWALAWIVPMCVFLALRGKGQGIWGVYFIAALGLLPCLWLHLRQAANSGFWQAAWVTSALFGFVHTGNKGENWIGIFAAAAIGFVFCVSIRVTGSAWWALGCHMSWDWSETYFYGTADSGMVAQGHLLTSTPAGNAFWSGGTNGPEGSILILPIILLLLVLLLVVYGRKRQPALQSASEAVAG